MSTLSFTGERRVRFPAPDVARGFMLALIALANVPFWVRFFPDYPAPGQAALDAMSGVDQWWFLLRALFVDRRAYPLFSILFGFGMAIMAKRTIERERRVAREALPAELSAGWIPLQWQFFDEDVERRARRAASRLIRRRGWWMLAFGAVHSVIFQGDIIGTYGLVAVIFAEVIVMRRVWLRVIIGVTGASLSLLLLSSGAAEMGARPMTLEYHAQATLEATTPLWNLAGWLVSTPFTVLTTLVVPCVMLGVGVERWGALQDPSGHRCARRDCWWWSPGGGAGCAALRARPVGLGACGWLGLDVPPFSRVGCRWGVWLVGAPCSPGRGSSRGLGGVRAERGVVRGVGCFPLVLERDWPPVDDCVPGSDARLCRAVPGARSCGRTLRGRGGLRPHCTRRVGAHWSRVRYLRRDGTYAWSR